MCNDASGEKYKRALSWGFDNVLSHEVSLHFLLFTASRKDNDVVCVVVVDLRMLVEVGARSRR